MADYDLVRGNTVFNGKIIDIVQDTIVLPDKREVVREVVVRGGASAIVPVDSEGNIIFVRQYRHPAREEMLEIPAGMLEGDEEPLVCAERELEEETGFKAEKITFITKMYSAVGFCTEILYIYLAEGIRAGTLNLDEDEFISIETYSLEESVKMIFDGRIKDSKTMVGILAYKEILSKRTERIDQ